MNESQTRKDLIDPALRAAGWETAPARVATEQFAPGRKGRRARKADYVLMVGFRRVAVLEAKSAEVGAEAGEAQARAYAEALGVRFAFATNGRTLLAWDLVAGTQARMRLEEMPGPEALLAQVEAGRRAAGPGEALVSACAQVPWAQVGDRPIRYYQERSVEAVIGAIAQGKERVLLTLATGTGKTYIAYQLLHKLFEVKWSREGLGKRRPRVLFLAYLNALANQTAQTFTPLGNAVARLKANFAEVPLGYHCYVTIYQTLLGESGEETRYKAFPPDFFDLVIVDECHHGGSNAQSQWRGILDYFTGAVKLGLTATPVCNANRDTYDYFGLPVYSYSLKQGIEDGYLAPYCVKQMISPLERYHFQEGDELSNEAAVEREHTYTNRELYRNHLTIAEREQRFVEALLDVLPLDEKAIVFCENQAHAATVARLIRETLAWRVEQGTLARAVAEAAGCLQPDYCQRVTADDGAVGDDVLKTFCLNESRLPVILTTSEKLTTGVDACNVRAVVLMREVESEVTFKQIIGRGTRLCEGKDFFTIYDFFPQSNTGRLFNPEWDGGAIELCPKCGQAPCVCPPTERPPREEGICPRCGCKPCICLPPDFPGEEGSEIRLGKRHGREVDCQASLYFEGVARSLAEVEEILGERIRSVASAEALTAQWVGEETQQALREALAAAGVKPKLLSHLQRLRELEACDTLDLLLAWGYGHAPRTRQERITACRTALPELPAERAQIVEQLLGLYLREGEAALTGQALAGTLKQRYGSIPAALQALGLPNALDLKALLATLRQGLYR